jgi:putative heme-binding domain-containing protein
MYPLTDDGAGFVGGTEDVLNMGDDTWARPVDVAVAPDGAMLIADWYDPGVGGHMMGDPDGSQGRIYRLAPVGNTPQVPAVDLQSTEGLAAAFRSGNESVRYLAYRAIEAQGDAAVPMLQEWWREGDPILQARALWLLGGLGTAGNAAIQEALGHSEPRFRILGLRVARLHGADMIRVSKPLLRDPSPQVRREIALMLRDPSKMLPAYGYPEQGPATEEWLSAMAELAAQYDGQDRWYVEALGIAARGREEALYARLSAQSGTRLDGPFGRLLWVLRPRTALPDLIATINDASRSVPERLAALDAIGAMEWPEAAQAIEAFILAESTPELVERAFGLYSHQLGSQWMDSLTSPELPAVMQKALSLPATQPAAVVVATTLADPRYLPDLVALAKTASADPEARAGAVAAISATGGEPYLSDFQALAGAGPLPVRIAAMRAVSALAPPNVENWTQGILLSDAPNEVRVQALRLLGGTVPGLNLILDMAESGTLPPEFESLARSLTNFARPPLTERQQRSPVAMRVPRTEMPTDPAYVAIRERAAKILPLPDRTIPTAFELDLSYAGKVDAGRQLFETGAGCAPCHSLSRLGDSRRTLGMDLSTIGQKFDKQAMLDDLLNPNGAIQPEYVATVFTLRDGGEVEGLITAETPDQVTVVVGQQEQRLSTSEIASRRPVQISPMPEGLLDNLSLQQIADLLAFLDTLR